MEKVIALLREKNYYLEQFYFLNENELINLGAGDFDNVEPFYQARGKILDLIACIDTIIDQEVGGKTEVQMSGKSEVESLLRTKDEVVKAILAQDLQVLTYIEKEKSNIIRELTGNRQAIKAVGAYANTERMRQLED